MIKKITENIHQIIEIIIIDKIDIEKIPIINDLVIEIDQNSMRKEEFKKLIIFKRTQYY